MIEKLTPLMMTNLFASHARVCMCVNGIISMDTSWYRLLINVNISNANMLQLFPCTTFLFCLIKKLIRKIIHLSCCWPSVVLEISFSLSLSLLTSSPAHHPHTPPGCLAKVFLPYYGVEIAGGSV